MRRLLLVLLIAVMCLGSAGCGQDDVNEGDQDDYDYMAEHIENGTALGSFSSVDIDGNEVTDAVYANADVTVLNVWATYCDPCIDEMPDLGKWAAELPDNVQIIGVVIDAPEGDDEMAELARSIINDTQANYTNILVNDSMEEMLESVEAVPTTYILDSEGRTVCTPVIGASVDAYKAEVQNYLDSIK